VCGACLNFPARDFLLDLFCLASETGSVTTAWLAP